MLHFFWSVIAFIFTLGILIIMHEFGHFLVARYCGVIVERFSIGFGHTIWSWHDKSGTEYIIAAIPLGGYVKMLDERVDIVAPELFSKTFNHKNVWQRAAIISAGPIFNFLFAIFIYWLIYLIGIPSYRPIIGEVIPNSIAAHAKIFPGMEIKTIDGIETPDWDSVRMQLIDKIGNKQIIFDVMSTNALHSEQKILNLLNWRFQPNKQDIIITLGIIPLGPKVEPIIAQIQKESAAMKAGLQVGDRIIKINDQPVTTWPLLINQIRNHPGQPLNMSVERNSNIINITLWPDSKILGKGKLEGFAGVAPTIIPLPLTYKTLQQYGLFSALIQASKKSWQLMQLTVNMLGKLITGSIKLNNLSGPISIAQGAVASAEYGLIYYLMFLALISINLGIINLFPLPVLDGGHLLFLIIEKLNGKPISERIQNLSYRIGSILLILMMGLSLLNDFSRLF